MDDFSAAEARLLDAAADVRIGQGFDVHAFAAGDHVWLGGVRIPHDKSLAGHSDADVCLHALADALYGALGDGDIGAHFPPSDPRWRGAASSIFLSDAAGRVRARGGIVAHLDATLVCEAPKIGPHREAMRARIAEIAESPSTGWRSRRRPRKGWASPAAARASPAWRSRPSACRRAERDRVSD